MNDNIFVLLILFMTVVAPTWIVFHHITKWRATKTMSGEDETLLQELWESATKMETRIHHLESILDTEAPGWRGRE